MSQGRDAEREQHGFTDLGTARVGSPTSCLARGIGFGAAGDTLVASFLALIEGDCLRVFGGVGLLAVAANAGVDEATLMMSQSMFGDWYPYHQIVGRR